MLGTIKKVLADKHYGFIFTPKAEYFFHKSDFDGHWDDLVRDCGGSHIVSVEFEPTRTDKGLRATEVRRTDNG